MFKEIVDNFWAEIKNYYFLGQFVNIYRCNNWYKTCGWQKTAESQVECELYIGEL